MKVSAIILWLVALGLLSVAGWALFTEENLWGYPYSRVAGLASLTAAPFSICAPILFTKARRAEGR
jgi:hypothetical protein